jgi:putative flippase GtrA
MIAAFRSKQFLAFLVTGGLAALVNFGSRLLLSQWLSLSLAVLLAYLVGMATAFLLARVFVFPGSRQAVHRSALFFVLVNGVAVLQTWGITLLLAYYVLPRLGVQAHADEIAHAIGIAVPVFTSYIGHKRWSFADPA